VSNVELRDYLAVFTFIPSFIFTHGFPLRGVAGVASLGGIEISHGFEQSLIVLLFHTKTGLSQLGDLK